MSASFVSSAPPSPNVPRFFWMMKLTDVASLNSPILKPSPAASIACALSSMTRSLCAIGDLLDRRHVGALPVEVDRE